MKHSESLWNSFAVSDSIYTEFYERTYKQAQANMPTTRYVKIRPESVSDYDYRHLHTY